MEYTTIVSAAAHEAAPIKWMAPFAGCAMGEYFLYKGAARGRHVRRPLEACGRLPSALAAAAPPAGPRGVPRRCLLSPLAAARARMQALRRAQGGGSLTALPMIETQAGDVVRVHPDERHLHHRRPDLPRVRPLLLGRPSGGERRHLGLARRQLGADEGDEEGRRPAAPRPVPVPRAGGVRAVRIGARPGDAAGARPRRADGRDAQPAAVRSRGRWRSRSVALYAGVNGFLDDIPVDQVPRFQDELREHMRAEGGDPKGDPRDRRPPRRPRGAARGRDREVQADVQRRGRDLRLVA